MKAEGAYDNWAFHCHGTVNSLHQIIANNKRILNDRYDPVRFWNDETGISVDPDTPGSELYKAAVIIQKLVVSRAEGLGNHTWFVFRAVSGASLKPRDNFPSLDHLGRVRPVVLAHNMAATRLHGSRALERYRFGEYGEAYLFGRKNEKILAFWRGNFTRGQVLTVEIGGKAEGTMYDLFGQPVPLEIDGSLTLPAWETPAYLVLPADTTVKMLK